MQFEKDGVLSLWLFTERPNAVDNSLITDGFGVGSFDEDMLEVGGSDTWEEISLEKAFSPMSYSDSWREQAIKAANERNIRTCLRSFMILDFANDPSTLNKEIPSEPVFLGVFEYTDDEEF